jgi:hypothetical protein
MRESNLPSMSQSVFSIQIPRRPTLIGHAACCAMMLVCLSWALLTPDPYTVTNSLLAPASVSVDDFVQHLVAFAVLSLGCLSLTYRIRLKPYSVVGMLMVFAAATECLQSIVPGRTPDVVDLIANLTGIGVMSLVIHAGSAVVSRSMSPRDVERCVSPQ